MDTFWNEVRGVTVTLDGLGEGGREGVDLSPVQARRLLADLTAVLCALDDASAPEV